MLCDMCQARLNFIKRKVGFLIFFFVGGLSPPFLISEYYYRTSDTFKTLKKHTMAYFFSILLQLKLTYKRFFYILDILIFYYSVYIQKVKKKLNINEVNKSYFVVKIIQK